MKSINKITSHSEQFFDFLKIINQEIDYVIIRGFTKLPLSPDNDIDLVTNYKDFDKCLKIIKENFIHNYTHDYGFAEYANMINTSYHTHGKTDNNISHGKFYIDVDSSLFFPSPYKNYTTKYVVPHNFNEHVFKTKIKIEMNDTYFWIPSIENEIVLQILRNVLELKGVWKQKSRERIKILLKNIDKEKFIESNSKVLFKSTEIFDSLMKLDFNNITKLIRD